MPTILIVDDDETNLRSVSALVKICMTHSHLDMAIVHAKHGADAWEQIERPGSNVHMVISDVDMPEMDGTELSRKIHEKHPDITMILISGKLEPKDHKAHSFLGKPITMEKMLVTIRRLMK